MRYAIALVASWVIVVAGCSAVQPRTVPRVVDGVVEDGAFVPPYAYEWFVRGEVAAAHGRHDDAAIAFETARAAPSEDPHLLARLAKELELSHEGSTATRILQLTQDGAPQSESVWLATGDILAKRQWNTEALAAYQTAIELAPASQKGVLASAALLDKLGQRGRAQQLLLSFLNHNDISQHAARHAALQIALKRGDPEAVTTLLQTHGSHTRLNNDVLSAADDALKRRRPTLALSLVNALKLKQPTAVQLQAWVATGQSEKVEVALSNQKATDFGNDIERAYLWLQVERPEHTIQTLGTNKTPTARLLRGYAKTKQQQYPSSATEFSLVPPGASDYEQARVGLIQALSSQGRQNLAIEVGRAAIILDPDKSKLRQLTASLLADIDLKNALALLRGEVVEEQWKKAELLETHKKFKKAFSLLGAMDDSKATTSAMRARIQAEQLANRRDYEAAANTLDKYVSTSPWDIRSAIRLVELLRLAGRKQDAQGKATAVLKKAYRPEHIERLQ